MAPDICNGPADRSARPEARRFGPRQQHTAGSQTRVRRHLLQTSVFLSIRQSLTVPIFRRTAPHFLQRVVHGPLPGPSAAQTSDVTDADVSGMFGLQSGGIRANILRGWEPSSVSGRAELLFMFSFFPQLPGCHTDSGVTAPPCGRQGPQLSAAA